MDDAGIARRLDKCASVFEDVKRLINGAHRVNGKHLAARLGARARHGFEYLQLRLSCGNVMRRKIQTHFANETVGSSEPAKVIGRARCPARRTGAILVNPPGMQPHAHTHTRHVRKRRLLRRKLRRRHRVRERAHTAGGKFGGRPRGVSAKTQMAMHIEQGWGHRASFLARFIPH